MVWLYGRPAGTRVLWKLSSTCWRQIRSLCKSRTSGCPGHNIALPIKGGEKPADCSVIHCTHCAPSSCSPSKLDNQWNVGEFSPRKLLISPGDDKLQIELKQFSGACKMKSKYNLQIQARFKLPISLHIVYILCCWQTMFLVRIFYIRQGYLCLWFYIWGREWAVKVPPNEEAWGLSKSIIFPLIRSDQSTTRWERTPLRDSEGCAAEARLISLQLNEGIMSLNLAAISVYRGACLTLPSQGQLCINPQTAAWVTRAWGSSWSRRGGGAGGTMGANWKKF